MVVGEYGVGKIVLCKIIFNDEDVKSVYVLRIWVFMYSIEGFGGKILVLKKILMVFGVGDDLFKSIYDKVKDEVGNNLEDIDNWEVGEIDREMVEEKEVLVLFYVFYLNLRWKKYLIVFDDVREEDNWNEMF